MNINKNGNNENFHRCNSNERPLNAIEMFVFDFSTTFSLINFDE